MPEEKGLYWARVGDEWFVVNWQNERSRRDDKLLPMRAFDPSYKENLGYRGKAKQKAETRFIFPQAVNQWGERVVEPGEQ